MSAGLTGAYFAAAGGFGAAIGGSLYLHQLRREHASFAALVAAPLAAALGWAAVTGLADRLATAPAAAAAAVATPAEGAAPAPAAAAASEPASVAPIALEKAPPAAPKPVLDAKASKLKSDADTARRERRFEEARELYAKLAKAVPGDADAWADLADTTAAAAGGDLKAAAVAIDRALLADPDHPKALWLKASLELQEKRYTNALELWRHLLGRLQPGSKDATVVTANLEETRALAARQGERP